MSINKLFFNWSTGKDSALALYKLLQNKNFSIDKLLTTVNSHYNRVTMHGLRIELLMEQAEAIGIPLDIIELPENPNMETYNELMSERLNILQNEGFTHTAFGDIFLEDLRVYRENQLQPLGYTVLFPLWQEDTETLINNFVDLGFKSIVIAASAKHFKENFVGTLIDDTFLDKLPKNVDPCGENGEFHTFCFDGPIFDAPISFKQGETVYKEYKNPDKEDKNSKSGFWYLDLLPN